MMYPLVRKLAAEGVPVTVTCRVLNMARQPYYRWFDTPVSNPAWAQAHQLNALVDANQADPEYGYRLLRDEAEQGGWSMSRRTARRLAPRHHIRSVIGRKQRGSGKTLGPAVADDLVKRDFTANGPNQLQLTDITEHKTGEGTLYACGVKDVFSNRIVGNSNSERMTATLVTSAIANAVARRRDVACFFVHNYRGSQFRQRAFQEVLTRHGLVLSMGRLASAADNAAMESFHSLLQGNVLDRRTQDTREQLQQDIVTWIETK